MRKCEQGGCSATNLQGRRGSTRQVDANELHRGKLLLLAALVSRCFAMAKFDASHIVVHTSVVA
jgi:hypothetical protein